MGRRGSQIAAALLIAAGLVPSGAAEELAGAERFRRDVQPILEARCFGCHGYGSSEGGRTLDEFASDEAMLADVELWHAVLKNVRSHMMPPAEEEQPTAEERDTLFKWIIADVFRADPADPDPGHVTLRRLNRTEYRNTVRDLMGVEYDTTENFPPDDTGYGFDTIGDALSLSPLMMEKYILAADAIVAEAVPTESKVVPVKFVPGSKFASDDGKQRNKLSFYEPGELAGKFKIERPAEYRVVIEARLDGYYELDPGRCEVTCEFNGKQLFQEEYDWRDFLDLRYETTQHFEAGEYPIRFTLKPLVPADQKIQYLDYWVDRIRIEGPLDKSYWVPPANYDRFFPDGPPPEAGPERDAYAHKVLTKFVTRAYRRPVDPASIDRLVELAKITYDQSDDGFEEGIGQAMMAVLASPRFLFRVEEPSELPPGKSHPWVDEYALASRLSYFLWTTMPDQELIDLAARGQLRANLDAQIDRMIQDPRSAGFVADFTGQWLQARDVETIAVDPIAAFGHQKEWEALLDKFRAARERRRAEREEAEASGKSPEELAELEKERDKQADEERQKLFGEFRRFGEIRDKFSDDVRRAMRRETEMSFEHVMREDRSVLELLDADYTFVNEKLAAYYGIPGVKGDHMRRVELPADSPRGGVLTQGTTLVVTSNPTRTSPVKRGLFVLDNILGTPAPPPPEAVPPLEASADAITDHQPTLREALERHRSDPMCAGCHARMDPLGFALENFNAIGIWRDDEQGLPIDTAGTLLSGESFRDIRELKNVLKTEHRLDFYRCLTEKMLTYAVGRGLEYYDEPTVDQIAGRLDAEGGRFSVLLRGVVDSAAFQQQRAAAGSAAAQQQARHEPVSVR